MVPILWKNRWILLAVLGLVVLNYYPSLDHGYMIDDHLFRQGRWAAGYQGYFEFLTRTDSQHYSPLYFAVNYALFEHFGSAPQVMAALNILLFFFSLALFFLLTCLWTGSVPLAGVTVLLMALHPVFGFAVGYKTANFVLYCAIFQQLSLYFLWQSARTPQGRRNDDILSGLCAAAALLSNEWAVLLPFYAMLMLRTFNGRSWTAAVRRTAFYWTMTAAFVVLYALMAGARAGFIERLTRLGFSPGEYLAAYLAHLGDYTLSFFLPFRPTIFLTEIREVGGTVWASAAATVAVLGAVLWGVVKRASSSLPAFAVLWFLIGWLPVPVAMLGHPSLGLVFEQHWVFFATFGLCLATANMLMRLEALLPRPVTLGLMAALSVALLLSSQPLRQAMHSEKTFCEYWLKFSPENPIALSRLGQVAFREGDHARALALLDRLASASDGQHFRELNNIGLIYHDLGRLDKAERLLRQALEINPDFAAGWNNLGQVVRDGGQPQEALACFHKAHALDPQLPAARLNLADLLLIARHPEQARLLTRVLDASGVNPFYREQALILLTTASIIQEDAEEEDRLRRKMKSLFPSADVDVRLARKLLDVGQGRRAADILQKLLEQNPDQKEAYLLLGMYWGNREDWEAAVRTWERGQQRFPDDERFEGLIREAARLKAGTSR